MQCLVGDKRSKAKQRHVNIFSFCAKKKQKKPTNLVKSRWARFNSERFNVKTVQLFTFSRRQEQHKYFAFQRLCVRRKQKASLKENLQK